jgi:hypothetical protein
MIVILTLISQLALADSLYAHGYFEEARTEYLRAFFFYPELRQRADARLHYALSLLEKDSAEGMTELYVLVDEFPELPDSMLVEIARQFIRGGRYYLAIDLLGKTGEKKLLGLAYLLDGQLSNAQATFVADGEGEIADQIEQYVESPEKSERTATLLSLFLPGAGEIYSGNPSLGFRDFLFNFGSGYLLYNAFKQQKYVDATLVFLFLTNRFYLGSIYNAQKSANEYNEEKRRKWLAHLAATQFADTMTKTR